MIYEMEILVDLKPVNLIQRRTFEIFTSNFSDLNIKNLQ